MAEETTLAGALDRLAQAAAEAPDDRWTVTVLAAAVRDLEHAAGAGLGAVECDPLVVLQRRLGRVHRLLVAQPGATAVEVVLAHLGALAGAPPAPHTVGMDEQADGALVRC